VQKQTRPCALHRGAMLWRGIYHDYLAAWWMIHFGRSCLPPARGAQTVEALERAGVIGSWWRNSQERHPGGRCSRSG